MARGPTTGCGICLPNVFRFPDLFRRTSIRGLASVKGPMSLSSGVQVADEDSKRMSRGHWFETSVLPILMALFWAREQEHGELSDPVLPTETTDIWK